MKGILELFLTALMVALILSQVFLGLLLYALAGIGVSELTGIDALGYIASFFFCLFRMAFIPAGFAFWTLYACFDLNPVLAGCIVFSQGLILLLCGGILSLFPRHGKNSAGRGRSLLQPSGTDDWQKP